MLREIAPAISGDIISIEEAIEFGEKVMDRFSNPFIVHQWMSITLQYTSKMLMRNVPILQAHYQRSQAVPPCIALGFAGYILFMRCRKEGESTYIGTTGEMEYCIHDDKAESLFLKWNQKDGTDVVERILSDTKLWNADLSSFAGFAEAVRKNLGLLMQHNASSVIKEFSEKY